MELNEAAVIVTGAARGIGRAIAEGFAGKGARVALVDILAKELEDTARELEGSGATVMAVQTDITDVRAVEAMAGKVETSFGPVEVLANVAGTFSTIGPVWEVAPERWLRDPMVNLYGTFLVCHTVVRGMVERGRGYVLNTVGGGVGDPHAYSTSYATSKAGVMRLTEGLAKECAPHGVKVFAMQPGAVQTEMTRYIAFSPEGRKWRPGFSKIFTENRAAPVEPMVRLALELVSGRADRLTGRYFESMSDYEKDLIRDADRVIQDDLFTLRIRR